MLTTHYMDEAEQLCDRLVVMDSGKIVAEGSPRELIERYSTREVVELRFAGRRAGRDDAELRIDGLAERIEALPDRVLLYTDDGDAARRRRARARSRARVACSCAAARSRTSSSASPAGRSSTDSLTLALRPLEFFARAVPARLARLGRDERRHPGRCTCSPSASGSASSSTARPTCPAASPTSSSSRPGSWPRRRCSSRRSRRRWPVLAGDQVGSAVPRDARDAVARARRHVRPPGSSSRSDSLLTATVYFIVIAAFGAVHSPLGVLAIPAAVLVGLSFTAPLAAWAARSGTRRCRSSRSSASSSSRCSSSREPSSRSRRCRRPLEVVAWLTPLWHGVDALPRPHARRRAPGRPLHLAYLLACIAAGLVAARYTYTRRLFV